MADGMRIAVVGAGITGIASALCLAREGHEVTLIDRVAPGDENQTSFGNAGVLASAAVVPVPVPGLLRKAPGMWLRRDGPLFLNPLHLPGLLPWLIPFLRQGTAERVRRIADGLAPLIADSVEQHEALAKGTAAARFIARGPYVYLYGSRAAYEGDAFGWGVRREQGMTWDEWDRAALLERDPHLGEEHQFGAALHNHGWIIDPAGYCKALFEAFLAAGGGFRRGEVVDAAQAGDGKVRVRIGPGGGGSGTDESGEIEAARIEVDRAIVAAGVWSGALAERLGLKPMLAAERGYHTVFAGANRRPPFPYMIASAKLAATPMEPGLRVAGLAEFAPVDAPAKQAPFALIRRRARRLYPGLEWERETVWMGRRPSTPDSLPLLGPAPNAPGIVFACGGQHLGLTMGAKIGRIAAGMATGSVTNPGANLDTAPYRVDRFGG